MWMPLIKYRNIVLTIITIHRTQSPLCLLFLVRLGDYIVNSLDWLWSCGVLGHPERKSRYHPRQGWNFTYYPQSWWETYHFKNTYSPITLANISSINLFFIFRCSSSPINPVYVSRVDFSDLVFSLSSYRHSYIGLVFSSSFLDS